MRAHGRKLRMPLSHPLPCYLFANRFYDSLPERLVRYLSGSVDGLSCIDVGANIGDTIAAMYQDTGRYLAIEPSIKYSRYLRENWGQMKNVTILETVCSSSMTVKSFQIVEKSGTAAMAFNGNDVVPDSSAQTLDAIADNIPGFAKPDVIKIDTDGHDFDVLAGAKNVITRAHPAVLFECDAFGRSTYVEDCLQTLDLFARAGYRSFLAYDNLGYLMGRHELSNLSHFKDLLLYQLTCPHFHYFDILVMMDKDLERFLRTEQAVFASAVKGSRV